MSVHESNLTDRPERIGDVYVARVGGEWRVAFSEEDFSGPIHLDAFPTEPEARAYALGYMVGATP